MLPKTEMVRKAVESLYDGVCTIIEYQKVKRENKSTGFEEVAVLENQPCRLSFKTISSTTSGESASSLKQVVVLFISPDVTIKPGSKVVVTQNNTTTEYSCSGQPAMYKSHQEVILELFERWS